MARPALMRKIVVLALAARATLASAQAPVAGHDAAALDRVLHHFVDASGLVDYRGLHGNRSELDAFLLSVAELDPESLATQPTTDQIAFWINAYNAITLQRILDHYPIQRGGLVSALRFPKNSIRQIDGVWDKLTTRVLGEDMTLDQIEHGILRKKFQEPRVHVALVCASIGCPPLRAEVYIGARLDEQLDDQCRRFFASPHQFQIDRGANIVRLSSILKWYGDDFIATYGGSGVIGGRSPAESAVLQFACRYLGAPDAQFILTSGVGIEYLDYDWSLNEQN